MGTKMGPAIAILFLAFLEEKFESEYTGTFPDLYKRYIDDCLAFFSGSREDCDSWVENFTKLDPSCLKFTVNESQSVAFLDILISC